MRWTDSEISIAVTHLKEGKTYGYIAYTLGRTHTAVKCKLSRSGFHMSDYLEIDPDKLCVDCGNIITGYGEKFCSHSCSAKFNNRRRGVVKICKFCDTPYTGKSRSFCGIECFYNDRRRTQDLEIESGYSEFGHRTYKRYLIDRYGELCMECGWSERNVYSGMVPIELEHVDGDSMNNHLDNLKLLCPNCHSLTPTYRALNHGNGRHKRRERYRSGKSY